MSTVGLDPTTVMQAAPWVADALNLKWPQDRIEVIEQLNKIRNLWYNGYSNYKLFDNAFHCICVSNFPRVCGTVCNTSDCYQAITLPPDVASIEGAWVHGQPLKLRSRWWEPHFGIDTTALPRVELVQMAEKFSTSRDLQQFSRLKVYAERDEDKDKIVMVEILTDKGTHEKLQFNLIPDAWATAPPFAARILSVVLPADSVGAITLAQENGYELSVYAPSEKVPHYSRYRLASSNCPATVLIQGAKRFVPVYFDHDIVELGDQLLIQSAARYFKFGEATTETKEINRAQYDRAEMERHLEGIVARHRGNAIQDQNPFRSSGNTRRSGLPGYGYR